MANQRARVLADDKSLNIKNGQIVNADAKLIKSLAQAGTVDPSDDAVAYAESVKAEEVTIGGDADKAEKPAA